MCKLCVYVCAVVLRCDITAGVCACVCVQCGSFSMTERPHSGHRYVRVVIVG